MDDSVRKTMSLTTKKTNDLLALLAKHREYLVSGSFYLSRTRCGRKACKCMSSEYRHEHQCLSFIENGKSRTRTIPDGMISVINEQTVAYRKARALRREVAKLADEIVAAVDGVIASAAERGQAAMLVKLAQLKGDEK